MNNINLERLYISVKVMARNNGLVAVLHRDKEYSITIYDGTESLFIVDRHGTRKLTKQNTPFTESFTDYMHGIYTHQIKLVDPRERF